MVCKTKFNLKTDEKIQEYDDTDGMTVLKAQSLPAVDHWTPLCFGFLRAGQSFF